MIRLIAYFREIKETIRTGNDYIYEKIVVSKKMIIKCSDINVTQ